MDVSLISSEKIREMFPQVPFTKKLTPHKLIGVIRTGSQKSEALFVVSAKPPYYRRIRINQK